MNCKNRKTTSVALLCVMATSIMTLGGACYMANNRVRAMDTKTDEQLPLAAASVDTRVDTEPNNEETDFDAEEIADKIQDATAYVNSTHEAYQKRMEAAKIDHMIRASVVMFDDASDMIQKYSDDHKRIVNKNPSDITCVSGLSAAQFDELIDKIIEHRGLTSANKLHGTGEAFAYIEKEYKINGIYVLAIFTQESGFATRCANTNNFAGIKAKRGYRYFETPSDCIYYEGQLLRTKYVDMGLVSLGSIGGKYCETGSWASEVGKIVTTYLGMLDSIV